MIDGFHEIWWIAAPGGEEWAGLRIAHFRKAVGGELLVVITGETDPRRVGLRLWADLVVDEGWRKVAQIVPPDPAQVVAALIRD